MSVNNKMATYWSFIFTMLCFLLIQCDCQKSCNCEFPHGRVSWCFMHDLTPINCDEGYEETVTWVICSSSGEWVPAFGSGSVTGNFSEGLCVPKSCPNKIPHGALSSLCSPRVGMTCDYSCESGYTKTHISILCDKSTNWSTNPHALCTNSQQCPYEVYGGDLDLSCGRHPGDSCYYTCREGFLPLGQRVIYCDSSLKWTLSLQSLCKEIQCPSTIQNGFISESCPRGYKDYCDSYGCNPGYVKPPSPPRMRCNASGQWDWSDGVGQACYREAALCPSRITNGEITWHCNRQAGMPCSYSCDAGCDRNTSVSWLYCGQNGQWVENTERLCTNCISPTTTTASLCPATIPGGRMDSSCSRRPYTSCYFTCDYGCTYGATKLYCVDGLYWRYSSLACSCSESSTSYYTPSYSSSTVSSSAAVIGGVIGAVAFVIILVAVCVSMAKYRKTQSQPAQVTATRPVVYPHNITISNPTSPGISQGVRSPTFGPTAISYANPSQQRNNTYLQSPYNYGTNEYSQQHINFVQEPPAYSSLSPKPSDAPPSYEQVTANPTEFKV